MTRQPRIAYVPSRAVVVVMSIAAAALALLPGCTRTAPLSPTSPTATADGAARLPDFPNPAYWTTAGPNARLPLISAHRGRPELPAYPENVLESLQRLHETGDFIAEVDVMRSADGVLFLFHDWDLDRLTDHVGDPSQRQWSDLDTMRVYAPDGHLSPYTIPSLDEVLAFAKGKLLLSLDRKGTATYRELYEAAARRDMSDQVSLILYDDDDLADYHQLPVQVPMNLSADTVLTVRAMSMLCSERFVGEPCPVNLFLGVGALSPSLVAASSSAGLRVILGTFGGLDAAARADGGATYRRLVSKGVDVIATNLPLLAARAVYATPPGTREEAARESGFGESPEAHTKNTPAPR